jgi:nondiscriminating aspartyl-tRNA synthetase
MIHPTTRVLAAELPEHVGETVEVSGWLHRRRELKTVTFLILRDRSGLAQLVLTEPDGDFPEETVLYVRGTVTANPQAPGGVELTSPEIEPLSSLAEAPPFDLYRPTVPAGLPTILDHAPVTLRHPQLRAPYQISAASVAGFRAALDALAFTEIHTP